VVVVRKQVASDFVSLDGFAIDVVERRRVVAPPRITGFRAHSLTVIVDSFPIPPERSFLDAEVPRDQAPQ
jgi:hypothetical protein